ncbi:hypothetical protein F4818DRAFT_457321 [Hypoxylon cercidicola]|nr:hypothetical protein F4818DRAFT_457321 [Hypoxylon cercidicola]
MEPRTFHPFSWLPKELRDAIWDLAIRSDRPSTHFFTVFDCSNDVEWSVLSQYSMRHQDVTRCGLAAPQNQTSNHHQQQFSWTKGNRSVYMVDSGLWMACRESREAMERRFRVTEWDIERETMFFSNPRGDMPDAPATASFTSNGEKQRCLIYPKSDLILLQPYSPDTVYCNYLIRTVPIFDRAIMFYVSHVAIDFDPQWFECDNFLSPYFSVWSSSGTLGFASRAAADDVEWAENLWFVDYRIRRRPNALPMTTKRETFNGNGCKFTEVREGDMDWQIDPSRNVFDFLRSLQEAVDDHCLEQQWGILFYEINFFTQNDPTRPAKRNFSRVNNTSAAGTAGGAK